MRKIITDPDEMWYLARQYRGQSFAFDTETSGLNFKRDRLLGVSLYFPNGDGFYLAAEHTEKLWDGKVILVNYIPRDDLRIVLTPLFSQHNELMIAHNAKFDMHFLERIGVRPQGRLFDTLLAAQLLNENRPNGLKDLWDVHGLEYAKYQQMAEYKGYGRGEILGVPLTKAALYAINDVEATYKLYEIFAPQLVKERFRNRSLEDVFNEIWMPLLSVLQQMEARGIALDLSKVNEIREEYLARATELERKVWAYGIQMLHERYTTETIPKYYAPILTEDELEQVYENLDGQRVIDINDVQVPVFRPTKQSKERRYDFNTGSPKQLYELVFEYSNVQIPSEIDLKRGKNGALSCDKDNLETLIFYAKDEPPQFLRDILDWRKASKFIGTYLDRFLADADPNDYNSITTWFNQAVSETGKTGGTATGRLSSSSPNLQNIPSRDEVGKQARAMFVARPGYKLVVADYSQMELRVIAHYSRDEALIAAFEEEKDLHILTGAAFARTTYDDLLAKYQAGDDWAKKQRQLGKTGNFALSYGMGAKKFRRRLIVDNKYDIPEEQAADWIKGYDAMYQGATNWKKGTYDENRKLIKDGVWQWVAKHGYIYTIAGRKRRLPEALASERWKRERAQRQGVNAIIQGSCGDIICEAMIPIQRALLGIGGTLLLQVHDELVAEVPEQNAGIAVDIMNTFMNNYGYGSKLILPLLAEASIGDSWSSAKG